MLAFAPQQLHMPVIGNKVRTRKSESGRWQAGKKKKGSREEGRKKKPGRITRGGQLVKWHSAAKRLPPYLAALRHGSCPERLEGDADRYPRSNRTIGTDHGWRACRDIGHGLRGARPHAEATGARWSRRYRGRSGRSASSAHNPHATGPPQARRNRRPVGEGSAGLRSGLRTRRLQGAARGPALPHLGRLRRDVRERHARKGSLKPCDAAGFQLTARFGRCPALTLWAASLRCKRARAKRPASLAKSGTM